MAVQAHATAKYIRTSAQKAGLVMDLIRGRDVNVALATLRFARKVGVASPFGDLSATLLRKLCEQGDAHANESKIFDVARQLTPDE